MTIAIYLLAPILMVWVELILYLILLRMFASITKGQFARLPKNYLFETPKDSVKGQSVFFFLANYGSNLITLLILYHSAILLKQSPVHLMEWVGLALVGRMLVDSRSMSSERWGTAFGLATGWVALLSSSGP